MRFAFALIVIASVLLGLSMFQEPFRTNVDGSLPFHSVPQGDSEAYHAARAQALTPKYRLQDYGGTLLTLGVSVAVLSWRPLKAPASSLGFIAVALLAPSASVGALVFDLVQGQSRWAFPPWADSLGIPLMGIPILLVVGIVWSGAHLILLAGVPRRQGVHVSYRAVRRGHPWLLLVCTLTALLVVALGTDGAYWFAIPGLLWLYFYASIAAVRQPPS